MADKRETYAGLLTGDQIGSTVTGVDKLGKRRSGVVVSVVHEKDYACVFLRDESPTAVFERDTVVTVS